MSFSGGDSPALEDTQKLKVGKPEYQTWSFTLFAALIVLIVVAYFMYSESSTSSFTSSFRPSRY